jgi:guanosine-3',5'-bis(diphosphate) 3'-pyrophosphohydrolase
MIGFRIIVPTLEDCYRALGIVHTNWKVVPGRFKDYISVPKHNDYRSIHTTIVGVGRQRAELQIRTEEMHRIAEFGIAAHALYKEGATGDLHKIEGESKAFAWLRSTIEHLTAGATSQEFLEYTKLELFQDQVFCFTPRGRLIALPRGATPIDFAYALHTDIGDTCVGAKINGAIMPLVTQLRSGDEVEIIRDQNHLPPSNWETIAATGKARSAIRRAVRLAAQQRAYALGEHVLSIALERDGILLDDAESKTLAEVLGYPAKRELLIAVGEGKVATEALQAELAEVKGVRKRKHKKMDLPVPDKARGLVRAAPHRHVPLPRARQSARRPARQGSARPAQLQHPGGCVTGRHRTRRPPGGHHGARGTDHHLSDPLRRADRPARFGCGVDRRALGHHRPRGPQPQGRHLDDGGEPPGSLAQISAAIAACEANIHNLTMRMGSPDFHKFVFELEVRDLAQLTDVLSTLKLTSGLSNVQRATIGEAKALGKIDWTDNEPAKEPA